MIVNNISDIRSYIMSNYSFIQGLSTPHLSYYFDDKGTNVVITNNKYDSSIALNKDDKSYTPVYNGLMNLVEADRIGIAMVNKGLIKY